MKSCAHVVEDTCLLVTHPVSDSFLLFESLCGFSLQELKIPDNGPKTVSSATFIRCTHGNLRIRRRGGGESSQGTAVFWGVMGGGAGTSGRVLQASGGLLSSSRVLPAMLGQPVLQQTLFPAWFSSPPGSTEATQCSLCKIVCCKKTCIHNTAQIIRAQFDSFSQSEPIY